jgi:hypothetical protein
MREKVRWPIPPSGEIASDKQCAAMRAPRTAQPRYFRGLPESDLKLRLRVFSNLSFWSLNEESFKKGRKD